jgi:hypothetical protein
MLYDCKKLFLPENREFLQASLDAVSDSLKRLSRGQNILRRLANNPRHEMKKAFREGTAEDINVFISVLPTIFRYSRTAKQIEKQFHRHVEGKALTSSALPAKDDPDMMSGAMLISKLHYNENELKTRDVESIIKNGIDNTAAALKYELERTLLDQRKRKKEAKKNSEKKDLTLFEKRSSSILLVINALNATIQKFEASRIKDADRDYEQLVDQILQPDEDYSRAMPITYSVLYCSVVNALPNLHVEAVGIPFPRNFLSRIVVKSPPKNFLSSGAVEPGKFGLSSRKGRVDKKDQIVPSEMNIFHLLGNWVGFYSEGMQEVKIGFDPLTRQLVARKIDGDRCVPAGEVTWCLDLSRICKTSNMLEVGRPYEVSAQVAHPGYKSPQFVLYTLTLQVLPASIFQPAVPTTAALSAAPYVEIQLTPVLNSDVGFTVPTEAVLPESEANSTSANMRASTDTAGNAHLRRGTTVVRTHTGSSSHPSLSTHSGDRSADKAASPTDTSVQGSAGHQEGVTSSAFVETTLTGMKTAQSSSPQPEELTPNAMHTPSTEAGTETSNTAFPEGTPEPQQALHPFESLSFCRTVDLDRCLLDISDQGVVPLTPFTYLAIMRK